MGSNTYRYFIRMAYMGTGYFGWQIQSVSLTIQGELERVLGLLFREPVRTIGAGRTDTGVHAREFYAHFDCSHDPESLQKLQVVYKANHMLAPSIVIYDIFPVPPNAHSRFHATQRTYQYYIITRKDPFLMDRAWFFQSKLDLEIMGEAAGILLEYNDFKSFSKSNTQVKTNICKIHEAVWEQNDHVLCFRITADRFLRNMVRAITGTIVEVGLHKTTIDQFRQIIESRDRRRAGYSVPAHGLFLEKIMYPESLF
ncbi:MAG: tRNA pseudouridine(38-40) synthase TruA [Bacteroidia bacterium]|nr:MAG: tRNA pseudouridine(38-40) synthase TruA [Bacteroidia bacterium]